MRLSCSQSGAAEISSPTTATLQRVTSDLVIALAVLSVIGQLIVGLLLTLGTLAAGGLLPPLAALQRVAGPYALWSAFSVAAIATGGSLVFSELGGYRPCELCWYERICMYALSILLPLLAWHKERWRARYLIPFPAAGVAVCTYHLLIENGVFRESAPCGFNATGVLHGTRCSSKWFEQFGYVTLPVLALTAFLLIFGLLLLASFSRSQAEMVG